MIVRVVTSSQVRGKIRHLKPSVSPIAHSREKYNLTYVGFVAVLQSTHRAVDLLESGVDAAEELRLPVGEVVHRLERDVEPGVGVVDREHVDAPAVVGQRPAGPAARRVPARDGSDTADVGEARERAEGRET